jgi:hypothetical protein
MKQIGISLENGHYETLQTYAKLKSLSLSAMARVLLVEKINDIKDKK